MKKHKGCLLALLLAGMMLTCACAGVRPDDGARTEKDKKSHEKEEKEVSWITETEMDGEGDYFAFIDDTNTLGLWKEGAENPILLTEEVFSSQRHFENTCFSQEIYDPIGTYRELLEKAFSYSPDRKKIYFPAMTEWKTYGIPKSKEMLEYEQSDEYMAELLNMYEMYSQEDYYDEEMLEYVEELMQSGGMEKYISHSSFIYDLYCYSGAEDKELIAEDVFYYAVDHSGKCWYCVAKEMGTEQVEGRELPTMSYSLYCYDGSEHMEIGELSTQYGSMYGVSREGSYAIYVADDGILYEYELGGESKKLSQEPIEEVIVDDELNHIVYRTGNELHIMDRDGEKDTLTARGTFESVELLGAEGTQLFYMDGESISCEEFLKKDEKIDEAQVQEYEQMWKLLKELPMDTDVKKGRLGIYDMETGTNRELAEGYVIIGPGQAEIEQPCEMFYLEMIPLEKYEQVPVAEFFWGYSPQDILDGYEYYGEEMVYQYSDISVLNKQAQAYIVTTDGMKPIENIDLTNKWYSYVDYAEDNSCVYVTFIKDVAEGIYYRSYAYGEDGYRIDTEGNCSKVVENASETAVCGTHLYYTRTPGDVTVQLYCEAVEGCILEEDAISLSSLCSNSQSESILLLGDVMGYTGESGTLFLYDGMEGEELAPGIYAYDFYGNDSVVMLQNRNMQEDGTTYYVDDTIDLYDLEMEDGYDYARLMVYEKGEMVTIAENVGMFMKIREADE